MGGFFGLFIIYLFLCVDDATFGFFQPLFSQRGDLMKYLSGEVSVKHRSSGRIGRRIVCVDVGCAPPLNVG